MIRLTSIFSIFIFTWIQFYNTMVFTNYEINKTAYIENFCENTAVPELQCNGKCHLSEQFVDLTDNSNEPIINYLPELLLYIDYDDNSLSTVLTNMQQSYPEYLMYSEEYYSKIEHPPQA